MGIRIVLGFFIMVFSGGALSGSAIAYDLIIEIINNFHIIDINTIIHTSGLLFGVIICGFLANASMQLFSDFSSDR